VKKRLFGKGNLERALKGLRKTKRKEKILIWMFI